MTLQPASTASSGLTAIALLGGEPVLKVEPRIDQDWITLVRQGLPSACVDSLVDLTRIPQTEIARALAIPERTLARRKREGTLSPDESGKFVRFARVVERAQSVFSQADDAFDWLRHANAALGGVPPISLLDTEIGADTVMKVLGRIEHGIYA